MAKENPATQAAGQTPTTALQPAKAQTIQNGMSKEKKGNCRPTIDEIKWTSMPVTCSSVVIGMPKEPNATGAVFAMSESPYACRGVNPS